MEEKALRQEPLPDDDAEICPFCGNVYRITILKQSEDFGDIGYRHCPFCGLVIDENGQLVKEQTIKTQTESF